MICDDEPSAEVYFAAVTRSQAKICFRDAERFVKATPELDAIINVSSVNLSYDAGGSYITTVSSEGRSLDGKRVHAAIVDELHEHPSAEVVDKMRAGTKGRRQALIFEITNSGYNRESVCYKHHIATQAVLNNTAPNDTWFGYIAATDEGDEPLNNEDVWIKANPNLGVSITRKYLREQVAEAKAIPTRQNIVLRLNFCQWTQANVRWVELADWDKGNEPLPEDENLTWHCGLDLSTMAYHFLGGVLTHAKALTAICCPTVNSYKRLVVGRSLTGATWAPAYVSYGNNNRSCMVRIPGGRLELRVPDGGCNPYLAAAAVIAAGMDGMKNQIDPGDPVNENLYEMSAAELRSRGIETLPQNLNEAIDALEADRVIMDALGPVAQTFVDLKRMEWVEYMRHVSDWEIKTYLEFF
jgi:hypothetical protein